ncbi:MAG: YtxH domain-containing protein [Rhodothermales bacterium]|nr:YtxH domain-containing protein [Rhodothermales bacterium]MCA0269602.1 YtxH domain-containing protein [Bacteroidota bacterium]
MNVFRSPDLFRASLLGLVVGGSAGFLTGLLMAPDRGERLRRRLAFRIDQAAADVEQLVDRMLGGEHARVARDTGRALVSDAEAEAARIRGDIDRLLKEQRSKR